MSENRVSDESDSNGSESGDGLAPMANNKFANDGSFLEMFKQMQKKSENQNERTLSSESDAKEVVDTNQTNSCSSNKPFVNINKRKPKTLKTGIIKKQKNTTSDDDDSQPTDAWNRYMKEVRKYKEKYGDDNDKNRPLVK